MRILNFRIQEIKLSKNNRIPYLILKTKRGKYLLFLALMPFILSKQGLAKILQISVRDRVEVNVDKGTIDNRYIIGGEIYLKVKFQKEYFGDKLLKRWILV